MPRLAKRSSRSPTRSRARASARPRARSSSSKLKHRAYDKPPRGGFWHVSPCVGNNRWRTLPFIGSHAEADYIADNFRRHCQRVAVHREGQPPRERVAPVLPKSYRPPRDAETIQKLLADFVATDSRANTRANAIVLADALLEEGYDWAAYDLRASMDLGCRNRRGLAERILSEVLNGSAVLEHGEWNFPTSGPNPYVMILERKPIRFRGGTIHSSRRREPRIVIWARYGNRPDLCRWIRYGTYDATEFGSMAQAEEVARRDILSQKRPRNERPQFDNEFSDDPE